MTIDDDQLLNAADAVLRWVHSVVPDADDTVPYPPDTMGATEQPREFAEFTADEIEEATKFLNRCGFVRAIEVDDEGDDPQKEHTT